MLVFWFDAVGKPLLERFAAGQRERVDPFLGSRILLDAVFDDETALLQACQRRVDLRRLDVPIRLAADKRLKRRAQFVPMTRALCKET